MVVRTWWKYVQGTGKPLYTFRPLCIQLSLQLSFPPLALDGHCASFDIELGLYFLRGASPEPGRSQLLLLWASATPRSPGAFTNRQWHLLCLRVSSSSPWVPARSGLYCVHLVHIAPWTTESLFFSTKLKIIWEQDSLFLQTLTSYYIMKKRPYVILVVFHILLLSLLFYFLNYFMLDSHVTLRQWLFW